jgi:hypothetical protein
VSATGEDGFQALLAVASFAVFGLVWLGLATNIAKIARRQRHPPSFNLLLNTAHLGRFAGWALVGAITFQSDPITGGLLLASRLPGVALVGVTLVQRSERRPGVGLLLRRVGVGVLLLGMACLWLALAPAGAPMRLGSLPPAAPLAYALHAFVLLCFGVQGLYALPRQIWEARAKPLGNLRWFQLALLANYLFTLVYSYWAREPLVAAVMQAAYGVIVIEQTALVLLIERGVARKRADERGGSTREAS